MNHHIIGYIYIHRMQSAQFFLKQQINKIHIILNKNINKSKVRIIKYIYKKKFLDRETIYKNNDDDSMV